MKYANPVLLAFFGLISTASAFAQGVGTETCHAVSLASGEAVPIELKIEWGKVTKGDGDLAPYSIHETQAATVTFSGPVGSETYPVEFTLVGGTTRCNWWTSSIATIPGVAKIDLFGKWMDSCGFDYGETNTLLLHPNTSTETKYKLECQAVL